MTEGWWECSKCGLKRPEVDKGSWLTGDSHSLNCSGGMMWCEPVKMTVVSGFIEDVSPENKIQRITIDIKGTGEQTVIPVYDTREWIERGKKEEE